MLHFRLSVKPRLNNKQVSSPSVNSDNQNKQWASDTHKWRLLMTIKQKSDGGGFSLSVCRVGGLFRGRRETRAKCPSTEGDEVGQRELRGSGDTRCLQQTAPSVSWRYSGRQQVPTTIIHTHTNEKFVWLIIKVYIYTKKVYTRQIQCEQQTRQKREFRVMLPW